MKHEFDLTTYVGKIKKSSSYFYTFINKNTLATGVMVLQPGEQDTQEPHDVDEIYYVISGDGFLKIKEKNFELSKDRIFFVPKNTQHYFHGNKKDLKILYFFGGPDS